jgi:hypothetical protein
VVCSLCPHPHRYHSNIIRVIVTWCYISKWLYWNKFGRWKQKKCVIVKRLMWFLVALSMCGGLGLWGGLLCDICADHCSNKLRGLFSGHRFYLIFSPHWSTYHLYPRGSMFSILPPTPQLKGAKLSQWYYSDEAEIH